MPRFMLAAILAVALVLAAPGTSKAGALPEVGFGEQRSTVFGNPHWQTLSLRPMRLLVAWDALREKWQREQIDGWMAGADATGARVLVAFGRSRTPSRRRVLPSPRVYRRAFQRFRKRYPRVREYTPWNEANHCSQPTCHRPEVAARYFDVMRSACPTCTVVAADVLDSPDMKEWLQAFVRAARHKPRIWGLHNYLDVNYFRTTGTRTMLRTVRGRIWFTETGGLVNRRWRTSPYRFDESPSHAARATDWVFRRLAPLSSRVDRIYFYHFENHGREAAWDSAFVDPNGRPRPAYKVLVRWLARLKRARADGAGR